MIKKKAVAFALLLCVVAALAVNGTLAYLTDTDVRTNTITIGNVAITLDEAKVNKTQDNQFVVDPTAERVQSNHYDHINPGTVLPKDPIVHMDAGSNDAYVRMKVVVDNFAVWGEKAYQNGTDLDASFMELIGGKLGAGWTLGGHQSYGADDEKFPSSTVFVIDYKKRMTKGESTTAAFEQIVFPANLTSDQITDWVLGGAEEFSIDVFAEAVQAAGFASYEQAFADSFDKEGN
jgi:predicted ribosomally synthesized peptide with SipW-like signal peptide